MQNIDPASQLLVDNKKNVKTRARKSLIIRSGYPTYFLPVLVIPMSLVCGLYICTFYKLSSFNPNVYHWPCLSGINPLFRHMAMKISLVLLQ